jgi:hypothetical protein
MRSIGALLFSSFMLVTLLTVDVYSEDHVSDVTGEEIAAEVQIEEDVKDVSSEEVAVEEKVEESVNEAGSEELVVETPVEEGVSEAGGEDVAAETQFQESSFVESDTESFSDVLARDIFTNINISVKISRMNFTDDYVKERVASTAYYALDGYTRVYRNLFAGIELGYAGDMGEKDSEEIDFRFYNLQGNVKYAFGLFRVIEVDVGAGLSLIYVYDDGDKDALDRMGGWQVFSDLNWYGETIDDAGRFFIGLNVKYQQPQWKVHFDWDYANWQIGGHLGFMWE